MYKYAPARACVCVSQPISFVSTINPTECENYLIIRSHTHTHTQHQPDKSLYLVHFSTQQSS